MTAGAPTGTLLLVADQLVVGPPWLGAGLVHAGQGAGQERVASLGGAQGMVHQWSVSVALEETVLTHE